MTNLLDVYLGSLKEHLRYKKKKKDTEFRYIERQMMGKKIDHSNTSKEIGVPLLLSHKIDLK